MPSSKKNTILFAVGSPENIQSWVWRMWVQGDDVYLGARNALNVFKISLHKSNIWRMAFVEDLKRDNKSDRLIKRWNKPGEFTPGWTPSIGILVSSIDAKRPFKKTRIEDSRFKWFSPPLDHNKLLFKVLISKSGLSEADLAAVLIQGDRLVGKLLKRNGEIAWLVMREDVLTPIEIEKITDVMEKTKIHLKIGSPEDSVGDSRALLVVSEDYPSISNQPTILDIALGKENLKIPPK